MTSVEEKNGVFYIRFGGDKFSQYLSTVKQLEGREFHSQTRIWTAPISDINRTLLKSAEFDFINDVSSSVSSFDTSSTDINESLLKNFYPFQKDGVRFLTIHKGQGLIGDEMGLGKTIQAIGYFLLHPELRPVLVVCPASVKLNWQREIWKWTKEKAELLYGMESFPLIYSSWYIINYDILGRLEESSSGRKKLKEQGWYSELKKTGLKGIIIDEVQMISNPEAARTKAFQNLQRYYSGNAFISLSGTPIKNRPAEFFTLLNLLDSVQFNNRWKFLHRYCDPKYNGFGWSFKGATNIEELRNRISHYMIRRIKSEVMKDLPPKRKIMVPLELDPLEIQRYKTASEDFLEWLKEHIQGGIAAQEQMEKLRQQAYISKRNSAVQWIKDYLDIEGKLVVFAYHRAAIDDLFSEFKSCAVKLYGGMSLDQRQESIDRFQKDSSCKLFIGQIQAAGIGIDLTAASSVAFLEFPWTSSDIDQATDRIHRITQTADSVTAYFLVAPNTVEEDMMDLLQEKYGTLKELMDGQVDQDLFDGQRTDLMSGLLTLYRKKVTDDKE